nr:EOG090X0BTB [Chydorus sphaericus]
MYCCDFPVDVLFSTLVTTAPVDVTLPVSFVGPVLDLTLFGAISPRARVVLTSATASCSCFLINAFEKLKNSEFYEQGVSTENQPASSENSSIGPKQGITSNCKSGTVVVNQRQRGNPLLKSIRNVPWEYGEIIPDYVMGNTCCALFLSLRYHNLNPQYINSRLKELGKQYELRILLVQVDIKDPYVPIKDLTKICLLTDMTLLLAWSAEEAGRIIETYKIFERKPPDLIMEKQESNSLSKISDALTSIKSVNRTDAITLLSNFRTLQNICEASEEDLSLCPGIGPQKAKRIYSILHQAFRKV